MLSASVKGGFSDRRNSMLPLRLISKPNTAKHHSMNVLEPWLRPEPANFETRGPRCSRVWCPRPIFWCLRGKGGGGKDRGEGGFGAFGAFDGFELEGFELSVFRAWGMELREYAF